MNLAGELFFQTVTVMTIAGLFGAVWHKATLDRPALAPRALGTALHPRRLVESLRRFRSMAGELIALLLALTLLDALQRAVLNWWHRSRNATGFPDRMIVDSENPLLRLAREVLDDLAVAPFSGALGALEIQIDSPSALVFLGFASVVFGASASARETLRAEWIEGTRAMPRYGQRRAIGTLFAMSAVVLLGIQIETFLDLLTLRIAEARHLPVLLLFGLPAALLLRAFGMASIYGALRSGLVEGRRPWPALLERLGQRTARVIAALLILQLAHLPGMIWSLWTYTLAMDDFPLPLWMLTHSRIPFAWFEPFVLLAALEARRPFTGALQLLRQRPLEVLGTLFLGAIFLMGVHAGMLLVRWTFFPDSPLGHSLTTAAQTIAMLPVSLTVLALWIPWFAQAFAEVEGRASPSPTDSGA